MNRHEGNTHAKKVDVIIHGIETIGSAERYVLRNDEETF